MATHKWTWQKREAKAAALFGASRQRCSGSSGRPDCSRSDSTHPRLFIETKTRAAASMVTLFDSARGQALAEGKVPVLMLATKGRPGFLVVCRSGDLAAVASELAGGDDPGEVESLPMPPPGPSAA